MTNETDPGTVEPCPFCAAAMSHCSDKDGEFWMHPGVVTDGHCFMSGQGIFPRQLAAWNTRAAQSQPAATVQEVGPLTLKDVEAQTIALMEAASSREGMKINDWVATRMREAAERALGRPPSPQPDMGSEEALRLAKEALDLAHPYVADAVKADGGIEQCDIAYRMDLEKVEAASAALAAPSALPHKEEATPATTTTERGK